MTLWSGLLSIAAACGVVGPLAAHLRVLPPVAGLAVMLVGVGILLVTSAVAAIVIGRNLVVGAPLTAPLVGAAVIGVAVLVAGVIALPRPGAIVNDVTTDFAHPPPLAGDATSAPWSELARAKQALAHPEIAPLVLDLRLPVARARVRATLRSLPGWTLADAPANANLFHVEIASTLFRFVDDMAVRLSAMEDATRVDVRSRSRVGEGDLGANAAHIERLFGALEAGRSS